MTKSLSYAIQVRQRYDLPIWYIHNMGLNIVTTMSSTIVLPLECLYGMAWHGDYGWLRVFVCRQLMLLLQLPSSLLLVAGCRLLLPCIAGWNHSTWCTLHFKYTRKVSTQILSERTKQCLFLSLYSPIWLRTNLSSTQLQEYTSSMNSPDWRWSRNTANLSYSAFSLQTILFCLYWRIFCSAIDYCYLASVCVLDFHQLVLSRALFSCDASVCMRAHLVQSE